MLRPGFVCIFTVTAGWLGLYSESAGRLVGTRKRPHWDGRERAARNEGRRERTAHTGHGREPAARNEGGREPAVGREWGEFAAYIWVGGSLLSEVCGGGGWREMWRRDWIFP